MQQKNWQNPNNNQTKKNIEMIMTNLKKKKCFDTRLVWVSAHRPG